MNEALIDAVTSRVLEALSGSLPPALLIGREPPESLGYRYVEAPPYEAVVIGSLTPGELLFFRREPVLQALLEGMPVYLYTPGLPGKGSTNRALLARLGSAQRELKAWGVVFTDGQPHRRLISAEVARQLRAQNAPPPPGATLTPLARDILQGAGEPPGGAQEDAAPGRNGRRESFYPRM